MFLDGPRDQMRIRFQALRQHAARIPVPGLVLHNKILSKELQNHTVLAQLHTRGAIESAVHVTLFDLPGTAQFDTTPAISPAHGQPAEPDYRRFDGHLRAMLGLMQRFQNRLRERVLVSDPALYPSLRRAFAVTQTAHAQVLDQTDQAARAARPGIQSHRQKHFSTHRVWPPAVMRSSKRRSNARKSPVRL